MDCFVASLLAMTRELGLSFAGNRHYSAGSWSAAPWSFRQCRSRCQERPALGYRIRSAHRTRTAPGRNKQAGQSWKSLSISLITSICAEPLRGIKDTTLKPHSRGEVSDQDRSWGKGCGRDAKRKRGDFASLLGEINGNGNARTTF